MSWLTVAKQVRVALVANRTLHARPLVRSHSILRWAGENVNISYLTKLPGWADRTWIVAGAGGRGAERDRHCTILVGVSATGLKMLEDLLEFVL